MSGKVGDNFFRASGVVASAASDYDDDQIQSNIAVLGFYVAVNGSLVRYNLVDQSIDEFFDTSGVDASASTDDNRIASGSNYYYSGSITGTVTQDADSTGVDGDYTWYKWTDTAATGSYSFSTTTDHTWLVVGGGASGGRGNAGGGGAGGYRAGASLSLTGGNTYTITVGVGGTSVTGNNPGVVGGDSILSGTGITTITSTGGGEGANDNSDAGDGGSGGGGGYNGGDAGAGNTPAITPISGETTTVQGYAGGSSTTIGPQHGASGGGGASAVGANGTNSAGGDGGVGVSNDITGSATWYAGGGGGTTNSDNTANGNYGAGANGRTQGGGGFGDTNQGSGYGDATANTGGGGGGGQGADSGIGGTGIVILRRLTSTASYADMTLQSTDVTALSAPTYGEFVTLMENAAGTATLNTDIKGYISRDSGTTFTQGTLVDEGTWGTNKKILGFHDLDISSQPSGTSMCYKITTHNQSISKQTGIYATSIGWK